MNDNQYKSNDSERNHRSLNSVANIVQMAGFLILFFACCILPILVLLILGQPS